MTAVPMLPMDAPTMPVGLRANELAPHGREPPQSIAFFSAPGGDRPVVLGGGDEQDAVRRLDRLLQRARLRWVVGVVVGGAVQRQVADRDLPELQGVGASAISASASVRLIEVLDRLPTK